MCLLRRVGPALVCLHLPCSQALLSPPPLFSGSLLPSLSASLPTYIAILPHAGQSGGKLSQAFHPTADSLPF